MADLSRPMPRSGTTASSDSEAPPFARWRLEGIGVVRIVFGTIWAIDAWFKWQPGFADGLSARMASVQQGQPAALRAWIGWWGSVMQVSPRGAAYVVATLETAVALALILGAFTNLTAAGGSLLAVMIWTTGGGFGGPYVAGSTDVGASIVYVPVFAALFLTSAGLYLGLDRSLTPRLGRFGFLAAGGLDRGARSPLST